MIEMNPTDIALAKTAWQLSLKYTDEDFDDEAIHAELKTQGIDANDNRLHELTHRMLELDLLDVMEIGALYRCAWACSSSSKIELCIVPAIDELSDAVLEAVKNAAEPFGELVSVERD